MSPVCAQSPDVVKAFEQVATLIRDNRLAQAEKELTSILRVSPNLPLALNLMGSVRAKQGRLAEAESLFLRAVQNDKNYTGARMNLVYLYLLKRAPDKAITQLTEVLALEPENTEAKVILGDTYLAKNDLQKAEENYLSALDKSLSNAGALFGLAQISRLKGETKEASIYLNRVGTLSADSKSPDFLYKFALEAMRVNMFDEAKAALERSVELKPKDPSYLLALGIAWLRKGDLFEAEKLFRRLLALQPTNAQGQLHLGYVLLNQKKYAEARTWLEKSARPGAIPEVFYYLGLVAQEENDDARAIVLFEKAVKQLPSYAHARIALGSSYMKLKNYVRARQELETAVKLDPDEPTAHYNLALLYARIKEPARAQEELRIIEQLKAKGAGTGNGVVVLPPKSNP
ncbi:MAG TPA: tetratricopeptide repeat protein [Pyrinomonadaceae bacterium]|nr:tetratricopeptide repeat protein [Pyrinomonadaceae bacterium]